MKTNGKATAASVETAKAYYKLLKAQQRALPLADRWTMGAALRAAKAAAYVEIELLGFGLTS